MADYYTLTSFEFGISDEEASILMELDSYDGEVTTKVQPSSELLAIFPPTGTEPLSGYYGYLEQEGQVHDPQFARQLEKYNDEWYFAGPDINLGYISAVFAKVCTSAFPICFTWACTCSEMRENEFGGGVTIIDATGVSGWSTFDAIDCWRAA
jgi:hypothetical protein